MWNLEKFGDKNAIITENGDKITYLKLSEYSKELASKINSRCLIFNLCQNEFGALVAYVSFINSGIVPLMLKADLDFDLLVELIKRYKPDYLNVPCNISDKFPDYKIIYEKFNYSLLKTPFNKVYELNDELALLLTTSGSTGSPKLVRLSYKNLESNTKSIISFLKIDENERTITTLPMNYTYGLSIINTHLLVGASLVLTKKPVILKTFWQQLKDYKVTSFGGVPYTYEILQKIGFASMQLPYLKYVTQAGGKLSLELHEYFSKWAIENNKKFIVMYGQTEATARMAYLPANKSIEKDGSIGIAIPGGTLSLVDSAGNEIRQIETEGELIYKGDNVSLGYAENGDDLKKGDERFGILKTGDMAIFDKDGYFYIVGRKKRFLKIFGIRINLDDTESLIKKYFTSIDCACTGIDDKLNVFITDETVKKDIMSFLFNKLKLNPVSFNVISIPSIPRNESGKILYSNLSI